MLGRVMMIPGFEPTPINAFISTIYIAFKITGHRLVHIKELYLYYSKDTILKNDCQHVLDYVPLISTMIVGKYFYKGLI